MIKRFNKHFKIASLALTALALSSVSAASLAFDFKDPKSANSAQFLLDAPLEQISGFANGISGTVNYDPSAPETTTGKIVIDAKSLTVGNPVMLEHMHGKKWLNVDKFETITFEVQSVDNIKKNGDKVMADVTGIFTLKGISKEITAPVSFIHLKDKLGARLNKPSLKGDLLVLRSDFTFNRSDFDIMPGEKTDKVSEEIEIKLRAAGAHQF